MKYAKLRGKIREVYGLQSEFAKAMGMNPATLSFKLNGYTSWRQEEMVLACQLLRIPIKEAHVYFLT
jgi:hypothetical protein